MSLRNPDRRSLLRSTVLAGVALTPLERAFGSTAWNRAAVASEPPPVLATGLRRSLSDAERAFLRAAAERLIPADEEWPGAADLGVVDFIEDQLAGDFGRAQDWYMEGPFAAGTKEQGYQSPHAPAALYRAAIAGIDDHCRGEFGRRFSELDAGQQDAVLKALEAGELSLEGSDGATFFTMLRQNTMEGYFSDPLYGGNRDMMAWRMLGYPGARYDYRRFVAQHGARLDLEPVPILGPGDAADGG